jgi:acetoacetyl-CoA synthetase
VKPVSTSSTVDRLTAIWQRVLQRQEIGIDDNFFDLGGDSALALELFNEISRTFGRDLPPVMIYQAQTLAALALLLEQASLPRFPPLVMLREGTKDFPLFITHGLGGSVIDFFQVVKFLETPHAVYGMQGRGIDGVEDPFDSIEEMAEYSLKAVKEVQPHGPYLLAGFSLGGLVALEMAQQLRRDGEEIALLAMLDSYPHVDSLSQTQRTLLTMQQWQRRVSKLIAGAERAQVPGDLPLSAAIQRFRESGYRALERYRPKPYAGGVSFVRAAVPTTYPSDPRAVWGHLLNHLDVDTVPGDHLEIMTTYYRDLAAVLSRYLRETAIS